MRMFAEKTAWWNHDFPKVRPVKQEAKISAGAVAGRLQEQVAADRMDRNAEVRMMAPAAMSSAAFLKS